MTIITIIALAIAVIAALKVVSQAIEISHLESDVEKLTEAFGQAREYGQQVTSVANARGLALEAVVDGIPVSQHKTVNKNMDGEYKLSRTKNEEGKNITLLEEVIEEEVEDEAIEA